ncbi:transcription factor 12 like protein, partial [Danaus plexippus plexippus]
CCVRSYPDMIIRPTTGGVIGYGCDITGYGNIDGQDSGYRIRLPGAYHHWGWDAACNIIDIYN